MTLAFVNHLLSQRYVAVTQVASSSEETELGMSLAAHFARGISSGERNLSRISRLVCTSM